VPPLPLHTRRFLCPQVRQACPPSDPARHLLVRSGCFRRCRDETSVPLAATQSGNSRHSIYQRTRRFCLVETPRAAAREWVPVRRSTLVPVAQIAQSILVSRGQRVLLDSGLAALYAVAVGRFNEQVRRNRERFPADFMFQLMAEEWTGLRSQFATLKHGRGRHRKYRQGTAKGSPVSCIDSTPKFSQAGTQLVVARVRCKATSVVIASSAARCAARFATRLGTRLNSRGSARIEDTKRRPAGNTVGQHKGTDPISRRSGLRRKFG
jgi:hypothetical protein